MLEIKLLQNPKLVSDVPETGQFEYDAIPGAEAGVIAQLSYVGKHGYPYSFRTVRIQQANEQSNSRGVFNFKCTSLSN
ncbi:hypothetical protein [Mucilaginibacter auburnensis]|uniref:Uncharacterized protein n=1 Tax=Mucilaginibacter auburnensis TaxID=1457233 RepID=A0A2H9VNX1_9SPHI|nr:hypothetical protein [Mucilaginibacter auburnensis]PJJ80012.1 hypothetical protein CLV57_3154 [Mucilaginibacter auburnensis]